MQTRLLTLTLALLLLLAGCKEDAPQADPTPQLPPETQVGAGTLGFKIGDKIYAAASASGRVTQLFDNTFAIESGAGSGNERWGLTLQADSIYSTGNYTLDTLQVAPFTVSRPGGYFLTTDCVYETFLPPNVGRLTITRYDPAARIISGRFEIRMFSNAPQCAPTINVTDGRFDVRF